MTKGKPYKLSRKPNTMVTPLKTLIIGAGDRGKSWRRHAKEAEATSFRPIAVADPNGEARG